MGPRKQKGVWAKPIPLLVRVVIASGLIANRDPKGDLAPRIPNGAPTLEAATKYRRITKAGALGMHAGVVYKGINRKVVWMVEDILHGHVPNDFDVLLHIDRLEHPEAADVCSGVADTVARCVAKRCAELLVSHEPVHDEAHVRVGYGDHGPGARVQRVQADQSIRRQRA